MGKVIRLTESDLINLVNRIIKEQKMVDRPHDKMVIDCLTKDGFKLEDTNKKYPLFMTKNDSKGMIIQVISGEDPTEFSMGSQKNGKPLGHNTIKIGTTTNCKDIVKFANSPTL